MSFHDRSLNTSGDTEFGTPRLFVDAQHTSDQLSRSNSASGPSMGRPRPNSWMHPSSHDQSSDSIRSMSRDNIEAAFQRPASSQGNHSNLLSSHNGGADVATKRASSASFGPGPLDVSNSAFDPSDPSNTGILSQVGNRPSPALATGSLGRNNRAAAAALGRATPTLNVPSYMNLSGGLLSPTAATIGSGGPSVVHSPVGSPLSGSGFHNSLPNRSVSAGHIFDKQPNASDDLLGESPLIKDMLERLTRVESGMKDFSRQISGISRNVSLLLERTKSLPPASLSSSGGSAAQGASGAAGGNTADEVRSLNAQVSALANSVSHLLTLQGNGTGGVGVSPAPALSGLGLAVWTGSFVTL